MRNHEEFTKEIYHRSNQYIVRRRRRIRTAVGTGCGIACLAVLLVVSEYNPFLVSDQNLESESCPEMEEIMENESLPEENKGDVSDEDADSEAVGGRDDLSTEDEMESERGDEPTVDYDETDESEESAVTIAGLQLVRLETTDDGEKIVILEDANGQQQKYIFNGEGLIGVDTSEKLAISSREQNLLEKLFIESEGENR